MKLLLDECLPEELKELISEHEVLSVGDMKWKGIKNGELMKRAAEFGFTVFLTSDKNLPYQQNISKYALAVIVFDVKQNTIPAIKERMNKFRSLLPTVVSGKSYIC